MPDAIRETLGVTAAALAAAIAALALALLWLVVRTQRSRITTGREELIGLRGKARGRLAPQGAVLVAGELWQARTQAGETIEAGEAVQVTAVEGLTLVVRGVGRGS